MKASLAFPKFNVQENYFLFIESMPEMIQENQENQGRIDLLPVGPIRLASGQYGLGPIRLTSGQFQGNTIIQLINNI